MAWRVAELNGSWWGHVWDSGAVTGLTCPDGAMAQTRADTREEAERWCRENEREVCVRYRAWCAFEAGLPAAKREWLPYYNIWNADRTVLESNLTDRDAKAALWEESYARGW